jgi:cystathionine beta-lyase
MDAFKVASSKSALHNNLFGIIAQDAAYNKGEPWLEELLEYLKGNLKYFEEFIAEKIPKLVVYPLEGTYLAWVDCTALAMDDEKLMEFMLNDAKLWLDEGTLFGAEGSMFMRFNLAAPKSIIQRALVSLEKAVNRL